MQSGSIFIAHSILQFTVLVSFKTSVVAIVGFKVWCEIGRLESSHENFSLYVEQYNDAVCKQLIKVLDDVRLCSRFDALWADLFGIVNVCIQTVFGCSKILLMKFDSKTNP